MKFSEIQMNGSAAILVGLGGFALGFGLCALLNKILSEPEDVEEEDSEQEDSEELPFEKLKNLVDYLSTEDANEEPSAEDLDGLVHKFGYLKKVASKWDENESEEQPYEQISFEEFKKRHYSQRTCSYFIEDDIFAGWDDSLEELDPGEDYVFEMFKHVWSDAETDQSQSVFIRDNGLMLDTEFVPVHGNWLESYNEAQAEQ